MAYPKQRLSVTDVKKGKAAAAVGYIAFLCFIPLLFKKKSHFAVFHAKQGFVLFCIECATVGLRYIPVVGELLFSFGIVACTVLSCIGIIKVLLNRCWEMPIIFEIAEKIP